MSLFRFYRFNIYTLGFGSLLFCIVLPSHDVLADALKGASMPTQVAQQTRKEAPLTGQAWRLADQAYKHYDAGRLPLAQTQAEQAIGLRPDVARLRLLLVFILQKQGKLVEANAAVEQAIQDGLSTPELLQARSHLLNPQAASASPQTSAYRKAFPIAARAYKAFAEQRFDEASRDAELAYLTDPTQGNWALLWLDALDAQQKYEQTAAAAQRAIDAGAPNRAALQARLHRAQHLLTVRQAYSAYARGHYQQAIEHARQALQEQPDNTDYQRLLMTTLSAGNTTQQREAHAMLNAALTHQPDEVTLLIQRAYLAQRLGQPQQALQDFRAARASGKAPPTLAIDEAYALAGIGEKRAAVKALKQVIDEADSGRLPLSAEQRHNTRAAIAGLSREWGASYAMGYRGARPASTGTANGVVSTPGNAAFGTAEVYWRPADFLNTSTRIFEVYGRLSHTLYDEGGRINAQTIQDPCSGGSLAVQPWQGKGTTGWPSTVGALGVRLTPSTATGLTFGLERRFNLGHATRRGTIIPADRDKRCALQAMNLSYPYQASGASGNWTAYLTYGFYEGTELRTNAKSWWTVDSYMQAGYITGSSSIRVRETNSATNTVLSESSGKLKQNQWFAAAEVRVGRSVRLDSISNRLVVFPYLGAGIDWLRQKDRARLNTTHLRGTVSLQRHTRSSWALGVGPGINLRYWFREDHYNTPRSYIDWNLQYRVNIGGADASRARGLFMSMTLAY